MTFYRYLDDVDVHAIDCSGEVDLELGVARLQTLEAALASAQGPRRNATR